MREKQEREQGKIEKDLKKKPEEVICKKFRQCGGCEYRHDNYKKQLRQKQKKLEELLKGFCEVHPIVGMKNPFYYRNKVHAVVDRDRKGKVITGVYKAGTHIVVPVDSCMIEDKKADEIIVTIRGMLKSFKIKTYDEDTEYGLLRHILIRKGFATGEIMVVLVTASPVFPSKNNFVKALLKVHPEITTIVQNINGRGTSMVLGEKEHILYGKGYIEDKLCDCTFRISSKSFYQVNPVQTEKLYKKAISLAQITKEDVVLDAYCGIGTIGLIASRQAKEIIGVELNKDAVKDAVANAKRNEIKNARFYQADAGKFLTKMAEDGGKVDVVLMDPPRAGSTQEFMDSICKMKAERVVYISCSPETLKRDLEYFKKKGYKAEGCWGYDLFPFTTHTESIVLLSKLKSNKLKRINVELEIDELDLTAAESKATYEEIKDYVLKQSGLKVSNLYIAQVKQKCGIIERENYNKPKNENTKQPKCPLEKEKAIIAALKYFTMI